MKPIQAIALFAVLGAGVAAWLVIRHPQPDIAPTARESTAPASAPVVSAPAPEISEPAPAEEPAAAVPAAETGELSKPAAQIAAAPRKSAPAGKSKKELQDPTARVALSLVGTDADAEEYWIEAINDPSLPAGERQDLIEDLNEEGLSNPRHPDTVEDMELIASRIQLIEELAPSSMDQVNADAFAEAYKDLVGLMNGRAPQ